MNFPEKSEWVLFYEGQYPQTFDRSDDIACALISFILVPWPTLLKAILIFITKIPGILGRSLQTGWFLKLHNLSGFMGRYQLALHLLYDDFTEWSGYRLHFLGLITYMHLGLKFLRGAHFTIPELMVLSSPLIFLIIRYTTYRTYEQPAIFFAGPLPFDHARPTTYYDIGETRLNIRTPAYQAYRTYLGIHGTEMEERLLILLSIRTLLLGI